MTWKLQSSDDGMMEVIPSAVPDSRSRVGYCSAILISREHKETLWIVPHKGGDMSYMQALNEAEIVAMDLRHQAKQNPTVKGQTHAPTK